MAFPQYKQDGGASLPQPQRGTCNSTLDGKDTAFGYVTRLVDDEWGYVTISELEALHIGGSIPRIECDPHFDPVRFSKIRALEGV